MSIAHLRREGFHITACMYYFLIPYVLSVSPAHDITYLDPFLGARTGSLYITGYKMYFKSLENDKAVSYVPLVPACMCKFPIQGNCLQTTHSPVNLSCFLAWSLPCTACTCIYLFPGY